MMLFNMLYSIIYNAPLPWYKGCSYSQTWWIEGLDIEFQVYTRPHHYSQIQDQNSQSIHSASPIGLQLCSSPLSPRLVKTASAALTCHCKMVRNMSLFWSNQKCSCRIPFGDVLALECWSFQSSRSGDSQCSPFCIQTWCWMGCCSRHLTLRRTRRSLFLVQSESLLRSRLPCF